MREIGPVGKKIPAGTSAENKERALTFLGMLKKRMKSFGQRDGRWRRTYPDGVEIEVIRVHGHDLVRISGAQEKVQPCSIVRRLIGAPFAQTLRAVFYVPRMGSMTDWFEGSNFTTAGSGIQTVLPAYKLVQQNMATYPFVRDYTDKSVILTWQISSPDRALAFYDHFGSGMNLGASRLYLKGVEILNTELSPPDDQYAYRILGAGVLEAGAGSEKTTFVCAATTPYVFGPNYSYGSNRFSVRYATLQKTKKCEFVVGAWKTFSVSIPGAPKNPYYDEAFKLPRVVFSPKRDKFAVAFRKQEGGEVLVNKIHVVEYAPQLGIDKTLTAEATTKVFEETCKATEKSIFTRSWSTHREYHRVIDNYLEFCDAGQCSYWNWWHRYVCVSNSSDTSGETNYCTDSSSYDRFREVEGKFYLGFDYSLGGELLFAGMSGKSKAGERTVNNGSSEGPTGFCGSGPYSESDVKFFVEKDSATIFEMEKSTGLLKDGAGTLTERSILFCDPRYFYQSSPFLGFVEIVSTVTECEALFSNSYSVKHLCSGNDNSSQVVNTEQTSPYSACTKTGCSCYECEYEYPVEESSSEEGWDLRSKCDCCNYTCPEGGDCEHGLGDPGGSNGVGGWWSLHWSTSSSCSFSGDHSVETILSPAQPVSSFFMTGYWPSTPENRFSVGNLDFGSLLSSDLRIVGKPPLLFSSYFDGTTFSDAKVLWEIREPAHPIVNSGTAFEDFPIVGPALIKREGREKRD